MFGEKNHFATATRFDVALISFLKMTLVNRTVKLVFNRTVKLVTTLPLLPPPPLKAVCKTMQHLHCFYLSALFSFTNVF